MPVNTGKRVIEYLKVYSAAVMASAIPWIIIPVLYLAGSAPAGDDTAKFLKTSSLNGLLVSLFFLCLLIFSFLIWRKKTPDARAIFLARETPFKLRKGVLLTLVIIALSFIVLMTFPWIDRLPQVEGYQQLCHADLEGLEGEWELCKLQSLRVGIIDRTGELGQPLKSGFEQVNYEALLLAEGSAESIGETIDEKKLDGIMIIPEWVLQQNQIDYYFKDLQGLERNTLLRIINPVLSDQRLLSGGYSPKVIAQLTRSVNLKTHSLSGDAAGGIGSMFLPFGLVMLMVFASMFSGGTLMQSIIKEKSNRIVELILSSISSRSLMTGKVLGYGVLGLIQVASINAIVGAGIKEAQSGSQSTGFLVLIPIIPIYFSAAIINNPDGTISRVLSYLPVTTPTTMLIRLGFSSPSPLELAATLIILIAANYLLVRLAAKIFRVGMLMYGKNANFKELFRWARSKDY